MQTRMPIRAKPFEHQRNACDAAIDAFYSGRSRGYALLMQMGCGKSLAAIGVAGRLDLLRNRSKEFEITDTSNEIEPQAKAFSSISIAFRQDFETFDETNGVLVVYPFT